MEDLANITKALGEMIDLSDEKARNKFLEKILLSVVPENDRFYWHYRLTNQRETNCEYNVTGNKKNPTIILGNSKEASDEDASDIHNNENVSYFRPKSESESKSTPHKELLHRLLLDKQGVLEKSEDLPEIVLSWEFRINFETAKAFRKSGGNYLRAKQ